MMSVLRYAIVGFACMTALSALAAKIDSHTRTLAASCAACHGHEGKSLGEIPSLAGTTPEHFLGKMKQYRDMLDDGSVMNQHAKGLTWEEIAVLADYFACVESVSADRQEYCHQADGQ